MIDLIPSFYGYLAAGLAVVIGLFRIWKAGAKSERVDRAAKEAQIESKRHERITDVESDLSNVHSDAERVRKLDDFARKHGA